MKTLTYKQSDFILTYDLITKTKQVSTRPGHVPPPGGYTKIYTGHKLLY